MSVATRVLFNMLAIESIVRSLGVATMPHRFEYPPPPLNGGSPDLATGTGDWQCDVAWSGERTVASGTPDDLDLRGGLTSLVDGSALAFAETKGIIIINMSTTVGQKLLVGAASATQAFSGFLGGAAHTLEVQPSGFNVWFAPLDGANLATAAGSADLLRIAAATGSITYRIGLIGASA